MSTAHPKPKHLKFSELKNKTMENFEARLAYFFDVRDPQTVAKYYIQALKALENQNNNSLVSLKNSIVPHLEDAYREIAKQRTWKFNIKKAATLEFELIFSQKNQDPFELIVNTMIELYKTIFESQSPNIKKAAFIRTFLYQYKIISLNDQAIISENDQKLLIALADESQRLLNDIHT